MSGGPVVVGLGQRYGGDDAVGLHVARALSAEGFTVREASDPAALLDILLEGRPVVLVDAVVGGGVPGTVLRLHAGDLGSVRPVSSHGLGVAEVIDTASVMTGVAPALEIVGIVVHPPERAGEGLSLEVAQAITPAAAIARSLCAGPSTGAGCGEDPRCAV
jgi:hydrogenase maturation protease